MGWWGCVRVYMNGCWYVIVYVHECNYVYMCVCRPMYVCIHAFILWLIRKQYFWFAP